MGLVQVSPHPRGSSSAPHYGRHIRHDLLSGPDLCGGHLHLGVVVTVVTLIKGRVECLVAVLPNRSRLQPTAKDQRQSKGSLNL